MVGQRWLEQGAGRSQLNMQEAERSNWNRGEAVNIQACPQGHISSSKALPPKGSRTSTNRTTPGNQAVNHPSLRRTLVIRTTWLA